MNNWEVYFICKSYDPEFYKIEDDCIELIDYGVQARYPFYLEIEEFGAENAIKSAERIKHFVLMKIQK
ncbi:HEPN domain-containing protein [Carboxydothermus pertinax]|uniref:DNA-binding protein n=1 Tax=Carboxydothermus pertinax TaxID=870242 RepID=A0A1L8CWZ5_9THEO|nr:HEPN domain-containing protein [Carboxydothermus pertinax]GAV23389.1 DNA-binding protein [Carboxydothermus pertinax]